MTTYSASIYKLCALLEARGWQVEHYCENLPEETAGRTDFNRRTISLNCYTARRALMVLAHEAGHVLSAERCARRAVPQSTSLAKREAMAYLYGWAVLVHLGPRQISKPAWREHHEHSFAKNGVVT